MRLKSHRTMYSTLFLSHSSFCVPCTIKKAEERTQSTQTVAQSVCTTSAILQETRSLFSPILKIDLITRTGALLTAS